MSQATPGRVPPHSVEAEEQLLSAVFLDSADVLGRCAEAKIAPESFYVPANRELYKLARKMTDEGKPVDLATVAEELKTAGKLNEMGGYAYLIRVSGRIPTTAGASYFIDKVSELSLLRDLIRAGTAVVEDCYGYSGGINELADKVESNLMAVTQRRIKGEQRHISETAKRVMEKMRKMIETKGAIMGLPTGFMDLDRILYGLNAPDLIILAGRPSCGKAQPLDSDILTPSGFVKMGSLKVGDLVIGLNGKATRVSGVFPQGRKQVYEVMLSDGTKTRCCDEHLWLTETRNDRRAGRAFSVKRLKDIRQTLTRADSASPNHVLPRHSAVEFDSSSVHLRIHPWVLGALIGDGSLCGPNAIFHKPEPDLQRKLCSLLPSSDVGVVCDKRVRIKRAQRSNAISETISAIREFGLNVQSHEKFIPKDYLFSSINNRLELLQGLVDTDGSVSATRLEYSTSSKRLADDVCFLARSLGFMVSVSSRIPKFEYNGQKKDGLRSYRLFIQYVGAEFLPFSSLKHVSRSIKKARHFHRSIVSVTPVSVEECQCISVESSDHIYLTDSFIPTHNTALALNIAENVAMHVNRKANVMVFSMEMSEEQLVQRMMCCRATVPSARVKSGLCSPGEMDRLLEVEKEIAGSGLVIDDSSALTVLELRARARRVHQKTPLSLIVVDYLQLMSGTDSKAFREAQIAECSRGLKAMAKELNVPVIALSQFNRSSEKENRRPRLSDLRESGSIEQDADVVLMLNRPKSEDDIHQVAAEKMELIIGKNRNGAVDDILLTFQGSITRFSNYTS